MPNFANRIAFRCSEQQWKEATIDGRPLAELMKEIGYNMDELVFYPGKPYLATDYKSDIGRLNTTNTAFKYGRDVSDEWNAELFFALASQLSTVGIQVGEYFTDEKTGACYRCTRIDGNWLIHDYNKSNVSFQRSKIRKSTPEDLKAYFKSGLHISEEKPKEGFKRARTEKVTQAVETSGYVEIGFGVTDPETIEKWIQEASTPAPVVYEPSPMTFQEILQCFGEGRDVCVGTVEDGKVECRIHKINMVTKTEIGIDGENSLWAPFDQCFRNTADFLKYALQKVS